MKHKKTIGLDLDTTVYNLEPLYKEAFSKFPQYKFHFKHFFIWIPQILVHCIFILFHGFKIFSNVP